MAHNDTGLEIGQTTTLLPAPGVLGIVKELEDRDYSVTGYVKPFLSGRWRKGLIAQNVSGGALIPGKQVKLDWSNGNGLIKIIAGCTTDDISDGNIDEYISSAGLADQSYGWVIIEGPTKFINQSSSTITAGNTVTTGTSARVVKNAQGYGIASCGRALETNSTADALFRCERFARTPHSAAAYTIVGAGSGYKIARGEHQQAAASDTVVTGLTTVVAVCATPRSVTVKQMWFGASIGDQAGTPAAGSILITSYKPTNNTNDSTPTAATDFTDNIKVNWIAIGT